MCLNPQRTAESRARQRFGAAPALVMVEEEQELVDARRERNEAKALRTERRPTGQGEQEARRKRGLNTFGKGDSGRNAAKAHRAAAETSEAAFLGEGLTS
jgi:hypothetical protein